MLTKFSRLATSGRHNSTMIADRPKLTSEIVLYGMSIVSIFTVESIQNCSPRLYAAYRERVPKLFAYVACG